MADQNAADIVAMSTFAQKNELLDLAGRIQTAHDRTFRLADEAFESAIECGHLLIEAKEALPHGQWLAWLEANTSVSPRQSQKYMSLARLPVPKNEPGSHLPTSINAMLEVFRRDPPVLNITTQVERSEPRSVHVTYYPAMPRAAEPLSEVEIQVTNERSVFDIPFKEMTDLSRPRVSPQDAVSNFMTTYYAMHARDRNEVAKRVLEYQLRQTDITPKQKAELKKVLEVLTDYNSQD